MELQKLLLVSVHHTTTDEQAKCAAFESLGPQLDDNGNLTGWSLENVGAFYQRGWVMRLHQDIHKHDLATFSPGLQEVVKRAMEAEATYIHFDGMIEASPDLPDYRH